jgi:hypothetical protein
VLVGRVDDGPEVRVARPHAGQKQSLTGQSDYKDNQLALLHTDGPPLVGMVTQDAPDKLVFATLGAGGKSAGLTFT